jgi:hypothetical protein
MKILLPVDGSQYTKRMLGYVAAHEELFGPQHEFVFATVVTPAGCLRKVSKDKLVYPTAQPRAPA